MKNYAKFCKLNIQNKTYQLNLTEGGFDGSNFIDKSFSVLRYLAPIFLVYFTTKFASLNFVLAKSSMSVLAGLGFSFLISLGCFLPHTIFGNVYNSIQKNRKYIKRIKEFYQELKILENIKRKAKTNRRIQKIELYQASETKKFLNYLESETKKFKRLTKHYYIKKDKKGYLDGLKGFALDSLETRQETIDKFLFHNAKLLMTLSPKHKDFVIERTKFRLESIKNGEPYYDEYIWTATTDENLIKNDCIDKLETSFYIESLQKLLAKECEMPTFEKLETKPKLLEELRSELNEMALKTKELSMEIKKSTSETKNGEKQPTMSSVYKTKNDKISEIFEK